MQATQPPELDPRVTSFVGQIISDRYRVGELIAAGGMGAVFRGEHLHMRKRVAIKILHAEMDGILELAEQFEREAIAGAHVTHPNVAIATDFGRLDDGSFFLVQEFLRGETLARLLEKGPLPVERAVAITKQIAGALQAVHAKGMVHRDVKPANVMLIEGSGDLAKLIDFGFAKVPMERMSVARADDPLRRADGSWERDKVFGTVGYLAPEAANGMGALDARSDLYALGVSLYEMLVGKRPFEAPQSAEIFRLHRTAAPPTFLERAPMIPVPAAIEGVVMRLLAKDPAARYQSGDEVVAALDRAMARKAPADRPRVQVDLSEITLAPLRRTRRGWLLATFVALATAAAVVALVPAVRERLLPTAPSASASTAGPASEPTAPKEVDGLGAAAWAARLLAAPRTADWKGGAAALAALAALDPSALRAEEMAKAAMAVAVGAARLPASDSPVEPIFALLTDRFGTDGLDLLYRIVDEQPPKHPAALRAAAELAKRSSIVRASLGLRVTLELREAPCEKKAELFDRAVEEGDARVLKALKQLRAAACRSADDPCCFRKNADLAKAIRRLEARLKQP